MLYESDQALIPQQVEPVTENKASILSNFHNFLIFLLFFFFTAFLKDIFYQSNDFQVWFCFYAQVNLALFSLMKKKGNAIIKCINEQV